MNARVEKASKWISWDEFRSQVHIEGKVRIYNVPAGNKEGHSYDAFSKMKYYGTSILEKEVLGVVEIPFVNGCNPTEREVFLAAKLGDLRIGIWDNPKRLKATIVSGEGIDI